MRIKTEIREQSLPMADIKCLHIPRLTQPNNQPSSNHQTTIQVLHPNFNSPSETMVA